VGRAQSAIVLARLYEGPADVVSARLAWEVALRSAAPIGYEGVARQAREGLERLAASDATGEH